MGSDACRTSAGIAATAASIARSVPTRAAWAPRQLRHVDAQPPVVGAQLRGAEAAQLHRAGGIELEASEVRATVRDAPPVEGGQLGPAVGEHGVGELLVHHG